MSKGKAFFSTLPGVVSGIAGTLTAVVGLVTVGVQLGWIGGDDGDGGASSTTTVTTEDGGAAGGGGTSGGGAGGRSATTAGGTLVADKTKLTFVPLQTKEMTVNVRNAGSAPVTLAAPEITGPNRDQYSAAASGCSSPLGAGRSCAVTVTFKPTRGGRSTATLVVAPASGGARAVEVDIEGNHLL
ncbi:MAG: hypothetical protein M3O23_01565 [Actinomycetota bacterium]|nr:hypothetical protein [Actinomycetota bacterium]